MVSSKTSFILIIIFFNLLTLIFSSVIGLSIGGLFLGSIVAMGLFFINFRYYLFLDKIFKLLLYLNLFLLLNNLFFEDNLIPPLFSSPDETYKKTILRTINIFGNEFRMRRATGLSDNIHVSSLLNLVLCYILWVEKKKVRYYIASVILFLSLNLQFILIYFIWMGVRSRELRLNFKTILMLIISLFLLFFLVDFFILSRAYYHQIVASGFGILLNDLNTYYNAQTVKSVFFGLKPGDIEDPYDNSLGYHLPLTDIGIIGLPIQFGLVGLTSILLVSKFWMTYAKNREARFILPLFFSVIHYFSLSSFLGVIFISYLVRFPQKHKT